MAEKRKKAKVYFEDGISLRAIEPGRLYSARIRMEPDDHLGGPHKKWYWSKSKQIEASSKAKAFAEAEKYRKELVDGDGGAGLTVAEYARQWQEERTVQAEATRKSIGIAKPSLRTIDRDEIEIRRIERLFPAVTVCELTPEHIERVITKMRKEGASEQTIFKMFKKLKQILRRPAITGHIDYNPCELVTTIQEPPINPVTKRHRRSSTTLELYAESVPQHEREVARTMDMFVRAALGGKAPEEQSLEAFREAITTMEPDEWPDWVRELAELVNEKMIRAAS